ncbi:IclR family transcriptional regulator domain-containing protein [Actinomycetospora termitidis]|uniref:IclR family transcriptional regulator C-terminal domain-containing protein n=1 Tax=Actinomycetospora termitidis TaxID=3053470 RepID=A0ABT7M4Q6_9PSEU|nr:IclR family transcriptional regulator C-terminal domain-containing protein [Actinomycetospora sp. Odt1-22]MDL5155204.1 IclR family transcriptional regulator C-terminal domain-containing protein [Actinomycetospora sp. Odt1-22]
MSEDTSGARSLKTAAMVLRALRLLGDHPEGLSPVEIAERLGKSPATARYVVNTLCEAGYARREEGGLCLLRPAPPWGAWAPSGTTADDGGDDPAGPMDLGPDDPAPGAVLAEAVTELYRRTRQRAYLVRRTGTLVASVCDVRGHQGLARLPGLDTHVPPERAHGLAFTKVLLAASPTYRDAITAEPLVALTPRTLTCPIRLGTELDTVARRGWASDEEEFAGGFATLAAPIASPSGTSTVALGLSCSSRRYAAHADELVAELLAVARGAAREWAGTAHDAAQCTCPDCGLGDAAPTSGPATAAGDRRPLARGQLRRRTGRGVSARRR